MPVEAPPREALDLQEAVASRPSPLDEDGNVLIHVIRPTVGQGLGSHLYTAEMLQENAPVFNGWRMYIDHQSPQAKRAAGGLPRSIQELGGRILEAKWDGTVPASGRFGQGAVVAKVKPVGQVKKLIEEDPELLEASIRAKATDVRPGKVDGKDVWVVEGISSDPPGSVDWVSEGGAGGRVVDLLEAMIDEEDALPEVDPNEDNTEVAEATLTSKSRDNLDDKAFAIPEDRAYPIQDEAHARNALARVAQNGSPDEQSRVRAAVKKRYPNISQTQEAATHPEEDALSANSLLEALRDDDSEVAQAVNELIENRVTDAVTEAVEKATEGHEEELEEARREAREEARDEANRALTLRDLRERAKEIIVEADLPDRMEAKLLEEYALRGDEPAPKLDRVDTVDEAGTVTQTAVEALEESVNADIKEQRDLIHDLNPTAVRGQGPSDAGSEGRKAKPAEKPYHREVLEEARIDPDEAYPWMKREDPAPADNDENKKEND